MNLLTTLFTLSIALTSLASPTPYNKRALEDYETVFNNISTQVEVLSTAVTSYTTGSTPGTSVQAESSTLVNIITTAATSVSTFDPLTSSESLSLVSPIQDLTSDVGDLIDEIIAAEPNFDADGLSADVLSGLQAQKAAAEGLRDAVTPKVPAALQGIAAELAQGVVTEIQRGIAAYSD